MKKQKKQSGESVPPPSRRAFLYGTGAIAASSLLQGCSLTPTLPNTFSCNPLLGPCAVENTQAVPTGPMTTLNVAIATPVLGTISSSFRGLSYDKSHINTTLFYAADTSLITLFGFLAESSVFRICGGSVETTVWTPSGAGQTANQVAPSDITALAGFIKATGWKIIYGLALATSTPAAAAAEATFAATAFGSSLLGFEIGNEPDNYVSDGYFSTPWGVTNYISLYQSFAAAVQTAVPGTPVIGPATASNTNWFASFAAAEANKAKLLTHHYYRAAGSSTSSTIAVMLSYPDTYLMAVCQSLQASSESSGVPWAMGETNSFYGTPQPATSAAHAAALWSLDHLFTIAQYGSSGVYFHGGGSQASGYGPIEDNGPGVVGIRPIYYGLYMFGLAGAGSLLSTTLSNTGLNVSAYAIQATGGGLNVVVVNKDPTQTLSVALTTPQTMKNGTLALLTNPGGLAAITGSVIQGEAISASSSATTYTPGAPYAVTISGSQVSCYVPPASAGLILLS
jgi:hypothetical protein